MGVNFKESDTPTQMAGRIGGEDITELVREYNRGRYFS